MEPSTLVLLLGVLACPICVGVMIWLMNKDMHLHHSMHGQPTSASASERLATLRAQQQALGAEIAEAARLVELEAGRTAVPAGVKSSVPATGESSLAE